jgi:hypothetical protein
MNERKKCAREGCKHNTERANGFCRAHCPVLIERAEKQADEKYVALMADGFLGQKESIRQLEERSNRLGSEYCKLRQDIFYLQGQRDKLFSICDKAEQAKRLQDCFEVAKQSKDSNAMRLAANEIASLGKTVRMYE